MPGTTPRREKSQTRRLRVGHSPARGVPLPAQEVLHVKSAEKARNYASRVSKWSVDRARYRRDTEGARPSGRDRRARTCEALFRGRRGPATHRSGCNGPRRDVSSKRGRAGPRFYKRRGAKQSGIGHNQLSLGRRAGERSSVGAGEGCTLVSAALGSRRGLCFACNSITE